MIEDDDDSYIRMVDFSEDEDKAIYCPVCQKAGYNYPLRNRVAVKGEEPIPESEKENWLQCHVCGWLCPIYQAEPEAEIQDSLQTIESPFDNAQGQFLSTENRTTQTQKRRRKAAISRGVTRPRSKRFKHDDKPDPEIQAELDRGNIVKILFDSNR